MGRHATIERPEPLLAHHVPKALNESHIGIPRLAKACAYNFVRVCCCACDELACGGDGQHLHGRKMLVTCWVGLGWVGSVSQSWLACLSKLGVLEIRHTINEFLQADGSTCRAVMLLQVLVIPALCERKLGLLIENKVDNVLCVGPRWSYSVGCQCENIHIPTCMRHVAIRNTWKAD